MDGFDTNEGIILIAATNRPDVLDPVRLRPGRFDRQVIVPRPDIIGREQILKVHAKKIRIAPDVNLRTVARGTPGFSGADLANIINESALLAARKNKRIVTMSDVEESRDKVMMGAERRSKVISDDDKKLTAYHEAGHAIVGMNVEIKNIKMHKATIIPRGRALGMVMWLPEQDQDYESKDQKEGFIAMAMGGRVAEEKIFGKNKITTGAGGGGSSDISKVTQIAKEMLRNMGCLKKWDQSLTGKTKKRFFIESITRNQSVSEETAQKIEEEVKRIVLEGYNKAKKILDEKIEDLHKLAKALIEYETLSFNEIKDILEKNHYPDKFKENSNKNLDKSKKESALGAIGLKPKPAI